MKHSCGSYVNKRLPCPICLSFFFSFTGFFEQWTLTYIYIYIYIYPFFFPTMLSLLISQFRSYSEVQPRFINFIPYLVADPSPPFTSVLMMLVFKGDSLHIPTTFSISNTNTFSISLSSPCSPSQTLSSVYSD